MPVAEYVLKRRAASRASVVFNKPKYVPPSVLWTGTEEEWRERTGQTTAEQRAAQAAEQTQTRMTFPAETRSIPSNQKVKVNFQPNQPQQQGTVTENTQKESPTAERIKAQIKREKDITESYYNLPGVKQISPYIEPSPSENFFANPVKYVYLGIPKAAAKFVVDLPPSTYILGGRAAVSADTFRESLFNKEYRENIYKPAQQYTISQVPKETARQFDISTPSGLVNVGLAAWGVKSIGKGLAMKRAGTKFLVEESATRRSVSPDIVYDETYVDIQAMKGNKPISIKGRATQTYFEQEGGRFGIKGSGELTDLSTRKVTSLEMRGTGQRVEGGYDVTTMTKAGGKNYLDITQSADLLYEPFESFKTLSITQEVPKGKTIYQAKPVSTSAGVTGEIYVEDLFKSKGLFTKEITTETGTPFSTEKLFGTNRFQVGAKTFESEFSGMRNRPLRTENIGTGREVSSGGGKLELETSLKSKSLPGGEQNLMTIGRQKALSISANIGKVELLKGYSRGATTISLTRQKSQQASVTKPAMQQRYGVSMMPQTSLSLKSMSKPIMETDQITKPIVSSKPLFRPTTVLKPVSKTSQAMRPATTTIPIMKTSLKMTPIMTTPIIRKSSVPIIVIPPFFGFAKGAGGFGKRSGKQRKKYMPSLVGIAGKIKAGRTKGLFSGLEIRGI